MLTEIHYQGLNPLLIFSLGTRFFPNLFLYQDFHLLFSAHNFKKCFACPNLWTTCVHVWLATCQKHCISGSCCHIKQTAWQIKIANTTINDLSQCLTKEERCCGRVFSTWESHMLTKTIITCFLSILFAHIMKQTVINEALQCLSSCSVIRECPWIKEKEPRRDLCPSKKEC